MVLIFGGAYQGKLAYAMERFGLSESDILKVDKWILDLINAEIDVEKAVQEFIENNPDTVVICDDISCGVVPIDPVMRRWREAVGRALAKLSQESAEVIRMFCGIPTVIKSENKQ
jgi:adenosyl cobinamide kinase/adenosyl cobinamide phosphate guanylyltransferase